MSERLAYLADTFLDRGAWIYIVLSVLFYEVLRRAGRRR